MLQQIATDMFAVPGWENDDAATEMTTCPLSEVTSVKHSGRSLSASGRIIRQGIKFESFEAFCKFVDGSSKPKVSWKDKKKHQNDDHGCRDNSDYPSVKNQKFNVEKLNDVLNEDKAEATSVTSLSTLNKLSKSEAKLRTSRFRYLNQQLYTQTGEASFKV